MSLRSAAPIALAVALAFACGVADGGSALANGRGAVAVAGGEQHTCALMASGGVKCWGANHAGQLGDGTQDNRLTAVDVAIAGATGLAAGYAHACAVTSAGAAMCWGLNLHGEVGNGGTPLYVVSPTSVAGLASGVVAIGGGSGHSCALMASGGVKCWGYNGYGQLGDGTTADSATPVDVQGLPPARAIAVGRRHTCAVLETGALMCWGLNAYGQLGHGALSGPEICSDIACSTTPVAVAGMEDVAGVSAGGNHTCAVTASGAALCWGSGLLGQLGDGTEDIRATPAPVSGLSSGVAAIAAGGLHTCALTTGGAVACWGRNANGELGDGSIEQHDEPVAVAGLASGVAAIGVGYNHSCAVLVTGGVRCWGRNSEGELGDGTTAGSPLPVQVAGLAEPSRAPGDVNCDKAVSSIDAALLLQYGAGLVAELACGGNADLDGNGAANAIDAALVLQRVAGLI